MCLTTLGPAGSILTYAHIPSPHWRHRYKSHSDAVEITLKKHSSLAGIRLRGTVMAANRKTRHNNSVHKDNTADVPFSFLATSYFKMATPSM